MTIKTFPVRSATAPRLISPRLISPRLISPWLIAGAVALGLCGAGCHSSPPPPLPVGVTPVDSSKPPPDMQALHQNSEAAKAQATQAGTSSH